MAKRKKDSKIEPPKPSGVRLPLDFPEIPESWMPVDDYSSHRPMLYRAILNTAHTTFFEFGTGKGSTPLLVDFYTKVFTDKDLVSYENDYQWFELMLTDQYKYRAPDRAFLKNHHSFRTDNLLAVNIWPGSIIFIDCSPAELRKQLISKYSSAAKLIIVHDTEPGAEYVYGMADILNSFNFRCDLIVDGSPQTTVVSNLYDFSDWKTVVNDQIQFI